MDQLFRVDLKVNERQKHSCFTIAPMSPACRREGFIYFLSKFTCIIRKALLFVCYFLLLF